MGHHGMIQGFGLLVCYSPCSFKYTMTPFACTGNGWAAAGILRVYATIMHSEYAPSLKAELGVLASWVHEIHAAMYDRLVGKLQPFVLSYNMILMTEF